MLLASQLIRQEKQHNIPDINLLFQNISQSTKLSNDSRIKFREHDTQLFFQNVVHNMLACGQRLENDDRSRWLS